MNILEKEIEDLLFEGLSKSPEILTERGLYFYRNEKYIRQPDLGSYGRPDIVGYTIYPKRDGVRNIHISIFELKKDEINTSTLLQASRYAVGVQHYINQCNISADVSARIYLIGKSIDKNGDFVFLLEQLSNTRAFTFSIDLIKGLKFTLHNGYTASNPCLPKNKLKINDVRNILQQPDAEFVF